MFNNTTLPTMEHVVHLYDAFLYGILEFIDDAFSKPSYRMLEFIDDGFPGM